MSDPLTAALVAWLLGAVDGSLPLAAGTQPAALTLQGGFAAVGEAIFAALRWVLAQWYWLMDWAYYLTGLEMLNPRYRYMHRAILVGLCVGVMAPLIGTFLVHRQLALIGDALAHTAFAGVAVGLFLNAVIDLGVSPYLTAVVVAMIAALFIELISETTDAYNDVSMAIVLSTGFALGTTLISLNAGGLAVGVNQFLFGSLSTVSPQSAGILLVLFVVIVGTVAVTRNQLLYVTFDETAAAVSGISVNWYNRVMVMLTAMVVVGAMQIMGVILVAAMLVVPVAGATQVSRSFTESLVVSVVLAELAVLLGIAVAYYGGVTAGGVIVLVAVGIYVCAVGVGKLQSARGGREVPEMGSIETDDADPSAGTGGD
ncbi:metal ABC transporter permease [Halorubrum sp. Atlit-26R]|uniref:metal ABC transporter permease n=1 Tax=Halorubrum sp. Atlit-26R TaxID=2282128 RepID=UPI000EF1F5E0|nr:metal ABC transporter permease [Halorubrum sp. Atlit-26R]RLM72755.1 metal ABC transporter permease [Halorubrum sp. Atlit-26R]